ncbi:MAG TPA: hypothetical protein VJK53_01775 [Candidatus Paceibacterota bacterium]
MARLQVPTSAIPDIRADIVRTFVSRNARRKADMAFNYALIGSVAHFVRFFRRELKGGLFREEALGILRLLARHGVVISDQPNLIAVTSGPEILLENKENGPLARQAKLHFRMVLAGMRPMRYRTSGRFPRKPTKIF